MTSDVFFASFRARSPGENKLSKIKKLFSESGFNELIDEDDLTAIKVHFGEAGNDTFVSPIFIRPVVDRVKRNMGKPFVTDTATLYNGYRRNAVDHVTTAITHGFGFSVLDAPVIIADGLTGNDHVEVEIEKGHFKTVRIASGIHEADSMIVMSHFKGHCMAGFGGAIKNLAMGCAPPAGKLEQHCAKAMVDTDKCIGCGKCSKACEYYAIHIVDKKSRVDEEKCISCGECAAACPEYAIDFDWEKDVPVFIEKMVEYAYGAVKDKKGKAGYINFLMNITPDCDCAPFSDTPIVPDIGILASKDPVAIDKASVDLVNKQIGIQASMLACNLEEGKDKFRGLWDNVDGNRQLVYGEKIGLGSTDYRLIEI
ncbi:4Fe-4S ferredoxin [Methanocella sp. CWC-04]|uniref:4Fe-4S ferredoxin n=1 Tax=Methanooceanicella nereidis TaxID=2052831 RepID=A0AAP2W5L7_9EURY|nr:DUF362 domain-containing protein [Methanocella sp. CWC-04]MCD1294222.1 4Fe-4S ferredoxin [Methanocella sp. CWC-04]